MKARYEFIFRVFAFLFSFLWRIGGGILFFLSTLYVSIAGATELITNGSFENNSAAWGLNNANGQQGCDIDNLNGSEQDITGWTIEVINGVDLTTPNTNGLSWKTNCGTLPAAAAKTGSYSVQPAGEVGTDGRTRIYQAFTTTSGQTYKVRFWLFRIGGNAENRIGLTIYNSSVNGTVLLNRGNIITTNNSSWNEHVYTFTATSSTSVIEFKNADGLSQGSSIDDVSVKLFVLPTFTTTKANYPYDPSNQKLKMIPGQNIVFEWGLRNAGGEPDTDSLKVVMAVPTQIAFKIGSVTFEDGVIVNTGANGAGQQPSATGNTAPNNTGMTIGTIEYSETGTSGPWGAVPAADFTDGNGSYDNGIRAIRVTPAGTMNDGTTSPHVGFRIYYQGQVK